MIILDLLLVFMQISWKPALTSQCHKMHNMPCYGPNTWDYNSTVKIKVRESTAMKYSPPHWGASAVSGHTHCQVEWPAPVLCRPGETLSLPLPTGRTYHHRKATLSLCIFVKQTTVDSSCNLYLDYINKHVGLKRVGHLTAFFRSR